MHDQAWPRKVLACVSRALKPGGTFLMADINTSSNLEENMEHPMGPALYAFSTLHCMTVSLALGGEGLGTCWGQQTARQLLKEAGFNQVESLSKATRSTSTTPARSRPPAGAVRSGRPDASRSTIYPPSASRPSRASGPSPAGSVRRTTTTFAFHQTETLAGRVRSPFGDGRLPGTRSHSAMAASRDL